MKFKAMCHANLLVLPDSSKEKTEGGILIPKMVQDKTKERPTGEVVLAGPGMKDVPVTVKPGDRILYAQATPIEVDGVEHHMVDMRAVVGIVE